MEARDDIYDLALEAVVEGVGKATEQGPSQPHSDLRKGLREFGDEVNDAFEGPHEVIA